MADDPVVEVGDVQRAVGADCMIDRAEPRVARAQEVGLLDRLDRACRDTPELVDG